MQFDLQTMMTRFLTISFLLVLAQLSCTDPRAKEETPSASKDDVFSNYLISVKDAFDSINSGFHPVKIIQLSKPEDFVKSHINGATNLWRPDYSTSKDSIRGLASQKTQIERILSESGVDHNTLLLLYDRKGNVDAFRFAWVLELYGFKNFKIINGGLQSWTMAEYPLATGPSISLDTTNIVLDKMDSSGIATFDEVREAMDNEDYIIIDTREPYEFNAEPFIYKNGVHAYKPGAFGRGRIPGSLHLNWSELVDLNGDHRIKSLKDIHYDLSRKNISPDKNIIVYCQSGSRSAHTYFVLRHVLNYPSVKNYDGSWIEWSYLNKNNPDNYPVTQNCDELCFSEQLAILQDKESMKNVANEE